MKSYYSGRSVTSEKRKGKKGDDGSLTLQELKEIESIFTAFDYDKSGTLSAKEIKDAMIQLGYDPKNRRLLHIVEELDKRNLPDLSFIEFKNFVEQRYKQKESRKEVNRAFQFFDIDGNGQISLENLRLIKEALGVEASDEDLEDMIEYASSKQDALVSLDDFYNVISGSTQE